jgi:hypothetical protein
MATPRLKWAVKNKQIIWLCAESLHIRLTSLGMQRSQPVWPPPDVGAGSDVSLVKKILQNSLSLKQLPITLAGSCRTHLLFVNPCWRIPTCVRPLLDWRLRLRTLGCHRWLDPTSPYPIVDRSLFICRFGSCSGSVARVTHRRLGPSIVGTSVEWKRYSRDILP